MTRLKRLLQEVHQRSLWQLLASYIVGAWLVLQIAETLASLIGLPFWFGAGVIVLLAFGLVLVLATGLVQVISAYRSDADRSYSGVRRLFSWKHALIAGLIAVAVLVMGTGGYMGLRAMGVGPMGSLVAKGVLEPGERIVLADFDDNAGDSLLALMATVAFRTHLSQSRTLRLAEPDYIDRVLSRMGREAGTPLDYELAREIAVREGLRAVIAGEVVGRGGIGYVLSARLVNPGTSEVLVEFGENARDSSEVLPAIERLSKRLRERAGESLQAIRSNPPLEQVTTASLEALKKYSQAMRQPFPEDGLPFLLEAVSIDSTFAAAYRKLAVIYSNSGAERRRAVESAKKAYEHRERLTERERYNTEATYHSVVTGDQSAELQALRRLVELSDSTDDVGLTNLGVAYGWLGEGELAVALFRRVIELGYTNGLTYTNLIDRQILNGDLDAAWLTLQEWETTLPDCYSHFWRASLVYLRDDIAETERQVRAWRRCLEAQGDSRFPGFYESFYYSWLKALQGKLADAEALAAHAATGFEELGRLNLVQRTVLFLGLLDIRYRGLAEAGVQRLERFLERTPIDSLDPLDRPYLNLAIYYCVADRPDRARALLREYETLISEEMRGKYGWFHYHNASGILAAAEGRYREAIAELRLALNGHAPHQTLPWLARAYELDGAADSAIAFYEQYVSIPDQTRPRFLVNSRFNNWGDAIWLPSIYERLGNLHEQQSDTAKAIYYYGKLVNLWEDADPELQPRVEAARRAIEALSTDM